MGNYKKVHTIPMLLTGKNFQKRGEQINIKDILDNNHYSDGCIVNLDMRIIDLIEQFNRGTRRF